MSNLFHPVYDKEQRLLEQWVLEHECPFIYGGAIGGSITYSLTPTQLGTVTKVTCACGAEYDATDYNSW